MYTWDPEHPCPALGDRRNTHPIRDGVEDLLVVSFEANDIRSAVRPKLFERKGIHSRCIGLGPEHNGDVHQISEFECRSAPEWMVYRNRNQYRFRIEDDQGKFAIAVIEWRAHNRDVYRSASDEINCLR